MISPNTHIIDLPSDSADDSPSTENINGTKAIDLDNANRDQGQKRMKRKNNDLVCVVCGGQAYGYHYGAITCNSCKLFFTRNGRLSVDKIHCRHGQDRCPVSHDTQRKCTKCRLARCFSRGMRTEYFLTEKTKQGRKNENDHVVMDTNEMNYLFSHVLPVKDWLAIQSIQSSYLLAFQEEFPPHFSDLSDPFKAISCWSQMKHQIALHLITFFRHIDEFETLNIADRCILVKSNFFNLILLHKWSNYDASMGLFADLPQEVQTIFCHWIANCHESMNLFHRLVDLRQSFENITEREPTLVLLVSVMVLFSTGVLMAEDRLPLTDLSAVHRAQSHYTRLIWNYLMDKHSEEKVLRQFTQLMDLIVRMQIFTKQLKDSARERFIAANMVDRLSPLIQNALEIS